MTTGQARRRPAQLDLSYLDEPYLTKYSEPKTTRQPSTPPGEHTTEATYYRLGQRDTALEAAVSLQC